MPPCVLIAVREDLGAFLDRAGGEALRRALLDLAGDWAAAVAPGRPARRVRPAEVASAAREAFASGCGPVLVAAADAPRLGPAHARMALGDLEAGADASLGPGMDGGWYLAALAQPHDVLLGLLAEAVDGAEVMGRTLAVAQGTGIEVGLLRMERLLRTRQDARAVTADPLTPDRVRAALRRMG